MSLWRQLVDCKYSNSMLYFYTVLIAHNSSLLLKVNTFANNSGGNVHRMMFTPGGGIAVAFRNITFLGQNTFQNNTCTSNICWGGSVCWKVMKYTRPKRSNLWNYVQSHIVGVAWMLGGNTYIWKSRQWTNLPNSWTFVPALLCRPFAITDAYFCHMYHQF